MIAYALFATSRKVIVGPDTTIALLAGSVIAPLAMGDPARATALAATLALMAGRCSCWRPPRTRQRRDMLSTPVLVGYAAGAALVLVGTQLPVLMGVALPRDPFFYRVYDALQALPHAHWPTLALGVALLAFVLVLSRVAPRAPAALLACIAPCSLRSPSSAGARRRPPAAAARGFPAPALPSLALADLQSLAPVPSRSLS